MARVDESVCFVYTRTAQVLAPRVGMGTFLIY